MPRLSDLYGQQGQSPWLDNLRRDWLQDGTLQRWLDRGVRGVTSNPTIFEKAMSSGTAYDAQLRSLIQDGASVLDAYWAMVKTDIVDALDLLEPLHQRSDGTDGFVSLELAPDMARNTAASIEAARAFHTEIDRPNLFVKIPATEEGIPAIRQMIAEGRSINVTLIFSIERYDAVVEAYLSGLEQHLDERGADTDLGTVRSVASFFLSRVDTEVDRRLGDLGTAEASELRGRAAVAQAKLAHRLFQDRFSGPRWDALASKGAHVQRPLWASTSTKDPSYPDTLYVDTLIAPDTVNTMPEDTLEAFDDHGTVARTADDGVEEAEKLFARLEELGIDVEDVSRVLEKEGVDKFATSFDDLIQTLERRASALDPDG
ncbi:MAG TPA: transaldolase [Acidimicrobiales bacterium]|nr:transaldolase [Acidimicrobiales bacterium]